MRGYGCAEGQEILTGVDKHSRVGVGLLRRLHGPPQHFLPSSTPISEGMEEPDHLYGITPRTEAKCRTDEAEQAEEEINQRPEHNRGEPKGIPLDPHASQTIFLVRHRGCANICPRGSMG